MSLREEVARQAYVWGLATVRLYAVLYELVLAPKWDGGGSGMNRVLHGPFSAEISDLVGPVAPGAAPFCAWLDLRNGPLLVERPHGTTAGSAAAATLLDLYADVVGQVPEELDTSVRAALLAGPSWEPAEPTDAVTVLRCPTDLCLAVGQVRADDVPGYNAGPSAVLAVGPVTGEDHEPAPLPPPVPPVDVRRPPTVAFLRVLDWMLTLMPTLPGEDDLRADLQVVGVAYGPAALDEAVAQDRLDGQVTAGLRRGFQDMLRSGSTSQTSPQMSSRSRPRRTASWARATESLR